MRAKCPAWLCKVHRPLKGEREMPSDLLQSDCTTVAVSHKQLARPAILVFEEVFDMSARGARWCRRQLVVQLG